MTLKILRKDGSWYEEKYPNPVMKNETESAFFRYVAALGRFIDSPAVANGYADVYAVVLVFG